MIEMDLGMEFLNQSRVQNNISCNYLIRNASSLIKDVILKDSLFSSIVFLVVLVVFFGLNLRSMYIWGMKRSELNLFHQRLHTGVSDIDISLALMYEQNLFSNPWKLLFPLKKGFMQFVRGVSSDQHFSFHKLMAWLVRVNFLFSCVPLLMYTIYRKFKYPDVEFAHYTINNFDLNKPWQMYVIILLSFSLTVVAVCVWNSFLKDLDIPADENVWIRPNKRLIRDLKTMMVKSSFWIQCCKWAGSRILVVILLFVLITPAGFDLIENWISMNLSPYLSSLIPSAYVWLISKLVPPIVKFLPKWTASENNPHADQPYVTVKIYAYLLYTIVLLPSIGLPNIQAYINWAMEPQQEYRLLCLFRADNSGFFTGYVITSTFGTALDLINVKDLILHTWRWCRNKHTTIQLRRELISDYDFATQNAWSLVIFTIVTMYSISCPLITLPGMFYFFMRDFVDKYNTLFSHPPSDANRDIFKKAFGLIIFSFLLLQITVFYFAKLHYGIDHPTTLLASVLLGISVPLPIFMELKRQVRRCGNFIRYRCGRTRPYLLPM